MTSPCHLETRCGGDDCLRTIMQGLVRLLDVVSPNDDVALLGWRTVVVRWLKDLPHKQQVLCMWELADALTLNCPEKAREQCEQRAYMWLREKVWESK